MVRAVGSFNDSNQSLSPDASHSVTATGCLEVASAAAVYLNELLLVPKFFSERQFSIYWVAIFLSVLLITIGVVLLIQLTYNVLWGPDPRRLGLWTNIESDFAWISIYLLFGACALRIWYAGQHRIVLRSEILSGNANGTYQTIESGRGCSRT